MRPARTSISGVKQEIATSRGSRKPQVHFYRRSQCQTKQQDSRRSAKPVGPQKETQKAPGERIHEALKAAQRAPVPTRLAESANREVRTRPAIGYLSKG